jgi:hypothetical protein
MLNQKRSIFRKESLERLSSPERLDQLMQVVSPRSWLPLVALGSIVGVAVIWSIYGRIPITVEGQGRHHKSEQHNYRNFASHPPMAAHTADFVNYPRGGSLQSRSW